MNNRGKFSYFTVLLRFRAYLQLVLTAISPKNRSLKWYLNGVTGFLYIFSQVTKILSNINKMAIKLFDSVHIDSNESSEVVFYHEYARFEIQDNKEFILFVRNQLKTYLWYEMQ